MKIGLIGASGSGKTQLANELAERLGKVHVVDDYVTAMEQETNMALGPFATYVGNIYVALGRYARERKAEEDADHVITCGTLIESAIYTATHFASLDEVLNEDEKREAAPRVDATMRVMSCLFMDIFKYDHAFYLPARTENVDTRFVDQQIQAAVGGFKLTPVTTLAQTETRLEEALKVLEGDEVPAS